jgi:general secretion pathway protein G
MKMEIGRIRVGRKSETPYVVSYERARGFTLVEIMVVVVILGILAATIIPQFIGTTQDAKIGAAKADVAQLKNAIDRFNINMDRYPTTEEGLKVLVDPPGENKDKWRGPYIDKLQNDPWGNPYQYRTPSTHRSGFYDVWSRGADKTEGGEGENADIGNW